MVFGKSKKTSLNPLAFVGVTKSEFKKRYAELLGDDLEAAWEYVRNNRPKKIKED